MFGKLIEVIIFYKVVDIILKLVNEWGGEVLVNIFWLVFSLGGDVVVEVNGVFLDFVLVVGEYEVIVCNDGKIYLYIFMVELG